MARDVEKQDYWNCPKCLDNGDGFAEVVLRTSKKGRDPGHKFLGCENFIKTGCRYTFPFDQCPLCNGKLLERISKIGNIFLGCANFSSKKCKYTRTLRTAEEIRREEYEVEQLEAAERAQADADYRAQYAEHFRNREPRR